MRLSNFKWTASCGIGQKEKEIVKWDFACLEREKKNAELSYF